MSYLDLYNRLEKVISYTDYNKTLNEFQHLVISDDDDTLFRRILTQNCDAFKKQLNDDGTYTIYTTQDQGCWSSYHTIIGILNNKIYAIGDEYSDKNKYKLKLCKEICDQLYYECLEIRNKESTR